MSLFPSLKDASILVTGHSGFTGGWVCHALKHFGAQIHGLALPPSTYPSLFDLTQVEWRLASQKWIDIANDRAVVDHVADIRPDAILHLAAQPLVLPSYADPIGTFRTNVLGTVNLLEAARKTDSVKGIVAITTDKVYANSEIGLPFKEEARLGGHDPYSASKAAAEMAIDGYRLSLPSWQRQMVIDTARGGNIIGGGDWSDHRLIPDYARAVLHNQPITIRNPRALRPWQHVLCLVHGYLILLDRILSGETAQSAEDLGEAWNFGPPATDCVSVQTILEKMAHYWSPADIRLEPTEQHEAAILTINSCKAAHRLGWHPPYSLDQSLALTAEWYKTYQLNPSELHAVTQRQLLQYFEKIQQSPLIQ